MPNMRSSSVLLIGGCTEAKEAGALRSVEEVTFSCSSSDIEIVSRIAGNLIQPRRSPAVLLGEDSIYVIGGCSEKGCHINAIEEINFSDGEWICTAQDTVDVEQRSCTAFCNLDERYGLVIGGYNGTECLKTVALVHESNHEVYSKKLNDLPFRLKNSAAVTISDDVILVFGGWDESSTMRTIFRMEFDRERQSYLVDMESLLPYAVEAHCCVSHLGYIYITGGYDGVSVVNTIIRYSVAAKSSEVLSTRLATARENHVCKIVLEKYLVIMAGWDGRQALDSVEVFEIEEEHPYLVPVNVEFKLSQKRNRPASVIL